jgi:hypothetical protein
LKRRIFIERPAAEKKKSQWIPELINQVSHREAAGSQTAEKSEFRGSEGHPKGVRVQLATSASQAFHPKKTNGSMKTSSNEAKSRLQAALWAEVLK